MGRSFPQITRFLRRLKGVRIEEAILFGSRARGDWLKESDWDLLLVSPDFKGLSFQERIRRMLDHWAEPEDLELFCYTPEEFLKKRRQIGVVQTAVRQGIRIPLAQTFRRQAA